MEVPEKIYVTECMLFATNPEITLPKDGKIEYIRKDAFVEKACEYLQINLWRVVNEESDFRQRFVTDFKKYMEE